MGLIVLPGPEGVQGPTWIADQKIWQTDDGRLVRDGDVDAAFLFATPGDPIPLSAAQRFGLAPVPEPEPVTVRKQRRKAQDKARTIRDVQQKERETLREQQARERAVTPEPEVETDG
jgi:hypothetical protein